MADPTADKPEVTDAEIQSNVRVVGDAPAILMGTLYQAMAHSTGILFENAAAQQQTARTLMHAATNEGVTQIYALDTLPGLYGAGDIESSVLQALRGTGRR
ncbi:RebB family R body protein [Inquilinus limosus]|uniref:RebB family R body protein n=1 Tax=Inquilinus limosus TaxID=171674 RepID=UPI003F173B84